MIIINQQRRFSLQPEKVFCPCLILNKCETLWLVAINEANIVCKVNSVMLECLTNCLKIRFRLAGRNFKFKDHPFIFCALPGAFSIPIPYDRPSLCLLHLNFLTIKHQRIFIFPDSLILMAFKYKITGYGSNSIIVLLHLGDKHLQVKRSSGIDLVTNVIVFILCVSISELRPVIWLDFKI